MFKSYKVRGGLHGVGISAVNDLSSELIARVKRSGYLWQQTYSEGIVTSDVEKIRPLDENESTGFSVTFAPDMSILDEGLTFNHALIVERCRELAYLLPQVTFSVEDEAYETTQIFNFKDGIAGWVSDLNDGIPVLHPVLQTTIIRKFDPEDSYFDRDMRVELALQFRSDEPGIVRGFVNTVEAVHGGTHIDGLLSDLVSAIGEENKHILNNLVAILHVYHPDPQFESQTEISLLNSEVKDIVSDCVKQLFDENPDVLELLQNKGM